MPRLWNTRAEAMKRDELRTLQATKLARQLARVHERSSYYREKFRRAGVNPLGFRELSELRDYPFFDKEEERISQERSRNELDHPFGLHITCDPREVNRVSASSGTTGRPTFSGFTRADRAVTNENMARALVRMGLVPGDVALHASVLSMWVAGLPVLDSMMSYGLCVVPVGALSGVERVAEIGREVRPRVMMCTVSFARHMIRTMEERAGIDPARMGLEKIIVFGEPGGSVDEIRGEIESGFGGAQVYDIMGSTGCHSPTGVSCEHHSGIHFFAEDNVIFEIIDPITLEPLEIEDGVEGEIVFTGLDRECGPLIRWREGDIIQVSTEPCPCGRPGHRMYFHGRADDMMLVKGVNVFPNAVRDVVAGDPEATGNIRILKPDAGPVVPPPVTVEVEMAAALGLERRAALAHRLVEALHHRLRFRAEIRLIGLGDFVVRTGATGKSRLVEVVDA